MTYRRYIAAVSLALAPCSANIPSIAAQELGSLYAAANGTEQVDSEAGGIRERGASVRGSAFRVSELLRPRVNFWTDIFARYGKNQSVIHHREFPQAIFGVIDLSAEAEVMGAIALEKVKKQRVEAAVRGVTDLLRRFADGAEPQSEEEQRIWDAMDSVPWGKERFARTVKEDLVRSQTGIRERYAEALSRSGRYMHILESIFVDEFRLPIELTRLPFVESSFDYKAYSSVGAAGIWQFMRPTGRLYMTVNNLIDERRDIVSATRGAARYLQSAYARLGSWPLALTSYNHGVAGVYKKVQKLGITSIDAIIEHPGERVFGFASGNFYPEFLAALDIYDQPQKFFPGLTIEPALRLAQFRLERATSVTYIKRELGISEEELRATNYAISEGIWKGKYKIPANYTLKVPVAYNDRLSRLKTPEPGTPISAPAASSIYGGQTYKVRKGDTLSSIAKKFGLSVSALKEMNRVTSDAVSVGKILTVRPKSNPTPTAAERAVEAREAEAAAILTQKPSLKSPASKSKKITVRSGDSLWSISRRVGCSVDALKRANPTNSKNLKPGMVLVVP